jgi:hypothetical protein
VPISGDSGSETTQKTDEIATERKSILDTLREEGYFTTSAPREEIATFREPEPITTTAEPTTKRPRRRKLKIRPASVNEIQLIGLDDLIANDLPSQVKHAVKKKLFEPLFNTNSFKVKKNSRVNTGEDNEVDVNERPRTLAHKFRNKVNFKSDGIARKEVVDKDGTVRGSYSYKDPSGKLITVKYTAGKDGFKLDRNPGGKAQGKRKGLRRLKVQVKRPRAKPSNRADTKAWIDSLFARTASPPRSTTITTTTTTTPPPPPPTEATTPLPPPPPAAPRRRERVHQRQQQSFSPQQQNFGRQQQQQFAPQQQQTRFQNFPEQPRSQSSFSRAQQRFQEQPRSQPRFQEEPRSQQQFRGQPRVQNPQRQNFQLEQFSEFNSIFHNQRFQKPQQQQQQQQQFGNFENFAPSQFLQQRLSRFSQQSAPQQKQKSQFSNFQTGFQ